MKNISYSFLRSIAAFVIGLVLVLFPEEASDYFVITIGVVFLVPSLISLIGYYSNNAEERQLHRFPIEALGSLLFGLWLVIAPGFFADLLTYVLAFILIMGGVHQVASLMLARRWTSVAAGYYIFPILILLAGLLALFNPTGIRSTAFIIIGVTSICYALNELFNWFKFSRHRPLPPSTEVVDAEVIEE